jgi:transcriptional regulator with XRE-family HTH domain
LKGDNMRISSELRAAIKLGTNKQYELAQAIGTHPSQVSGWLTGAIPVRDGDPRVLRLAELVGVPADRAFVDANQAVEIRSFRR